VLYVSTRARPLLRSTGCLQCVCSVLQCVAVCCSALQCVAVCCSVEVKISSVLREHEGEKFIETCSVLQCVAVCCSAVYVYVYI